MNGVEKYVTKSMPTAKEEDTSAVKNIAKARPRQKPTITLTPVSILELEWKWIDIETQRSHDHECYSVSKTITRLLRRDQSVTRGSDGPIHHSYIIEECRKQKFDDASQWLLERLDVKTGQKRRSKEKSSILRESNLFRISYCTFEQFKDTLEALLLILPYKTMYCYRKDSPSTSTTSGTRMS